MSIELSIRGKHTNERSVYVSSLELAAPGRNSISWGGSSFCHTVGSNGYSTNTATKKKALSYLAEGASLGNICYFDFQH